MTALADQDARTAIEQELDVNLVVEAAAGTGKTTALVRRIIALVESGRATLASIVCVTFTEKAAGEMKLRLRTALEQARSKAAGESRARFTTALAELELSLLGTIHGFCAELLRQRPVEAAIDPRFVVLDEGQSQRLFDEAFHDWFERQLAEPGPGVARVLRRKARDFSDRSSPRSMLFEAGRRLCDDRDMTGAWERPAFARKTVIDELFARTQQLARLLDVATDKENWLTRSIDYVAQVVRAVERRETLEGEGAERDYDAIEESFRASLRGYSRRFWEYGSGYGAFGGGYKRSEVVAQRKAIHDDWKTALQLADGELASLLREDLRSLVELYVQRLDRRGALDFAGLLLRARDLLENNPALRVEMRDKYTHILVDEFQDTDPIQVEILRSLTCADDSRTPLPGRLFLVGDPKQSIYRFRRADVRLYESVKRELCGGDTPSAKLVYLTTNFRSCASILELCNSTFAPAFAEQGDRQATYVPMVASCPDPDSQPTIVGLPVPRPYSDKTSKPKVTNWAVESSYPDAVGAYVDWLVNHSGWTVRSGDQRVPLEARHVCLLFRRFASFGEDLTRPYVRALESRKLPHVLVGGRSFYAREEIQATLCALSAIERPDDELAVYASLKGPFFALTDDALLAYRNAVGARDGHSGTLSPLSLPLTAAPEKLQAVADALAVLASLHRSRNRWPIARTVSELFALTRAQAGVAMWPAGEQALSNMLRLVDVARREDALGTIGFRAFVERIANESGKAGASEAPAVEEGSDGVRLMTVHKAKGLEFPVVILVDPTSPLRPERPSRWLDAEAKVSLQALAGCMPYGLAQRAEEVLADDEAENARLAYVAATRARDLLVVPVVGDSELEGWTQVLCPGIYPPRDQRHASVARAFHPAFGADAVLERPSKSEVDSYESVRPGELSPRVGTHKVVFWDPRALSLDVEEEAGVRQQRILAAPPGADRAAEGKRRYDAWQAERTRSLAAGGVPSIAVEPVTRYVQKSDPKVAELELVELPRGARRSGGKRFGTLVHALFAARSRATQVELLSVAKVHARALGATEEEVQDAAALVAEAWSHPLMVRALAAPVLHHEWPIELEIDGARVHGALDAAFYEEGSGWTVIDFKTDRGVGAEAMTAYRAQLSLYVEAIHRATGKPARGILFHV